MSDLISRQAVIDRINKLIEVEKKQGTDDWGYGRERVNAYEAMLHFVKSEYLYPSVEPEKCGDCISREAAIDAIEKCSDDLEKQGQIVLAKGLRASICVLLTVPNIENGQMWNHKAIWMSTVQGDTVICSQCGFESEEEADFCPNCHAYMCDD